MPSLFLDLRQTHHIYILLHSTMKKMVIKVNVTSEKQQQGVLKAVSNLKGIKNMGVDIEKGTLTVTGTVDPVRVIKKLRKCRKYDAIIDSIASEKKDEEKKKEEEKKKNLCTCPYTCSHCAPYSNYVSYYVEEIPGSPCVIL